jgi:hypothetical protein
MTKLLNLPGVLVENSKQTEDTLILHWIKKQHFAPAVVKEAIEFIKINLYFSFSKKGDRSEFADRKPILKSQIAKHCSRSRGNKRKSIDGSVK